ncbi:MAG: type II toxin-antitoxin system Phd/YefM family antitoxin, partial [Candidatus Omnitrophica bacterium]|nr:type II toxin-antitoxin system Phd/YefM family antitoxin [Candidatus Omnitrophota bacterium]
MVAKVIPAVEARVHLGEIMKRSFKKGERFIVEKSGIPMIAILNAEEYTRIIQEREEQFKIFDKIKS